MYIKKLIILFLIIILLIPSFSFADDILEENELDNFIEVSNNASNVAKEPRN